MMTRQKIKMEDSFQQVHTNLPYFTNQEPTYSSKYAKNSQHLAIPQAHPVKSQHIKYPSFRSDLSDDQNRPNAARNQILKELRQQYEILRNLSIEQSIHVPMKKVEAYYERKEEKESSQSSSVVSKQNKARDGAFKQNNRQVQNLYLQKKQLELVIGNSMRKIEELLNNQISLKKTIHQLKNQIEGKGGLTMEYEKAIKSLQKNEEQMQGQFARLKHQNEKLTQKLKDQNEKIRTFEAQQEKKERELKQAFDQQRKLHELLRIQKDKYLNLQIQCRSYKMQFEMLEKQKSNEINRLMRQFQNKEGGSEKQMAFLIQRLEGELRQKDKRYHELLMQRQKRKERQSDVIPLDKKVGDKDKTYLEEILFRSREINQNNNKAFTDGMNLIFVKMAELQKKHDETLKKEIQQLRKKAQQTAPVAGKKNSESDRNLSLKIMQLEKIIEREAALKEKLLFNINQIDQQKSALEQKIRQVQKKLKDHYARKENGLVQKFTKQFEQISENYRTIENTHNTLKAQYAVLVQKLKQYQNEDIDRKQALQNQNAAFREKQKRMEEQIRTLKRKADELSFQAQKNKKQGEFNLSIYKTSQQSDLKRVISQNQRISLKLKQTQEKSAKIEKELQNKLKAKEAELSQLKNAIETLRIKFQQQVLNQKKHYEEKISHTENRHSVDMKAFSQKFISVNSANEKLMFQLSHISKLESQLLQLRRMLKVSRNTSSGVDHLWQIKQTQYGNITHILSSLQQGSYH